MVNKCINSWEKFSSYVPLSFMVKDSIETLLASLPKSIKIADFGGGNPNSPQSSSYLLAQLLEKTGKDYLLHVYDLNGEQPNNDKIKFIKGALQETIDIKAGYDFAISVNALQTPSIPYNFSRMIHKSMKPKSYLLMLLPQKKMDEVELFQEIESIIKDYPEGTVERRYDSTNLRHYFANKLWSFEKVKEIALSMPIDKKTLDYYFMNPNTREKAKEAAKSSMPLQKANIYIKNKLGEYFSLTPGMNFEPIILETGFLEILAKRI